MEPENRLVARTLEQRWNDKLRQLAELEQAYAQAKLVQRLELTVAQRQQVLCLAQDLPTVWRSPTTTVQERKEMLGLLVKQVAITPVDDPVRQTRIAILWHTGATTELMSERPSISQKLASDPVLPKWRRLISQSGLNDVPHSSGQTFLGCPFSFSSRFFHVLHR